jgi:hypothetical protein
VERFTDSISMVSGFGLVRSREWFAEAFLSDVRQPGHSADEQLIPEAKASDPWAGKNPVWTLKYATKWIDPASNRALTYRKWTEYIMLTQGRYIVGDSQNVTWDCDVVIDRHPEIANGWTKDELRQMKDFFMGPTVILGGLLRLLPPNLMKMERTVSSTEFFLRLAEGHARAGRLPIMEESEKKRLLELAKQYEIREFKRPMRPEARQSEPKQKSLFD